MSNESLRGKTIAGLFWTFAERIGAQLVGFVVSIVLARLLMPEQYGSIAIVFVLINLCNIVVDRSFSKALVQKKDADELDYSTVFYFSLVVSAILYMVLYVSAPYIGQWYDMDDLCPVLRVTGIRLVVAAFNSVQKAKVSKEMQFKKFFLSTLGGTLASAVVGITLAYLGWGVWALVAQELTNAFMNTIILFVTVSWRPKLMFSFIRMQKLFGYGWKVLVTGLMDSLYEDFKSLYVGKLYNAEQLAYFTRGKQFPYLIMDNVNTSLYSVLFPAISSAQGDPDATKGITRRAMKTSAYILTPMMLGLAAVAEPLVALLLTEKWLPCVPFLQVFCVGCAITPLQTANIQAFYAVGRSDVVLKLNIVKKSVGLILMFSFARISVLAMTWAGVFTELFALCVNVPSSSALIGYNLKEQIRDIVPNWILSGIMVLLVSLVSLLAIPTVLELMLMILVGVVSYIVLSAVFRVDSFQYIWNLIRPVVDRLRRR